MSKSFALLLDPLRYIRVPGFGAVIFRRESPQITNQGGLWDTSQELYPLTKAAPRRSDLSWVFPGGQKIRFAHLQHEDDKLKWQGAQVPYLGFDELTHFSEEQFFYLLSRNRSMCGVPPCVRATTNPAPGWVKRFLAPWLDKGYPDPAKSGEIRHFIRKDGQIVWVSGDYRDEQGQPPKSVTFIRSTVYDNQKLLEVNPEYLTNLKSLPLVEQKRLLDGDWDVFEGAFFDEWSESLHTIEPPRTPEDGPLPSHWNKFGGLDWGYRDPFAFALCAMDEYGDEHVIESIKVAGLTNEAQADKVCGVLSRWGVPKSDFLISADKSMWNQKTINGLKAEADIEAFHKAGLRCAPSSSTRQHGWSQMRRLMHDKRLKVWKGYNAELIRLFPEMQYAEAGEDMDTDGDDHLHDALRYAQDVRPQPANAPPEEKPTGLRRYGPQQETTRRRAH